MLDVQMALCNRHGISNKMTIWQTTHTLASQTDFQFMAKNEHLNNTTSDAHQSLEKRAIVSKWL